MASLTKKTRVRRRLRRSKAGRERKKKMARMSTPPFPIHPNAHE